MRSGRLPEAAVDACAARLLRAALTLTEPQDRPTSFDKAAHHALARRAAAESAVLLKNEGDLLPLKPGTRVALIGNFAFAPRYQGAGSSMVNATQVDTMKDALAESEWEWAGVAQGYFRDGAPAPELEKMPWIWQNPPMQLFTASVWTNAVNRKESTGNICVSRKTRSGCRKRWPVSILILWASSVPVPWWKCPGCPIAPRLSVRTGRCGRYVGYPYRKNHSFRTVERKLPVSI